VLRIRLQRGDDVFNALAVRNTRVWDVGYGGCRHVGMVLRLNRRLQALHFWIYAESLGPAKNHSPKPRAQSQEPTHAKPLA
jgi:hypothetical protein